jgi:hypothetical protein
LRWHGGLELPRLAAVGRCEQPIRFSASPTDD